MGKWLALTAFLLFTLSTAALPYDIVSEVASAYSTHPPIVIDGNGDFTPENGVSGGSGTESDPYIIRGLEINASGTTSGIQILNSDVFFRIEDCYVHDGNWNSNYNGIILSNCVNGTLEDNILSKNCHSIYVYQSSNNIISNNTCTDNDDGICLQSSGSNNLINNDCSNNGIGISLFGSSNIVSNNDCSYSTLWGIVLGGSNNIVSNNDCSYSAQWGIYLDSSVSNTVSNNNCSNNNAEGIHIFQASDNNIISNNTCSNNGCYGMFVWASSYNTIVNNTCSNNLMDGIDIHWYSSSNNISNNNFSNNGQYGVYIWESYPSYNRIWNNTFYNNNGAGTTYDPSHMQAYAAYGTGSNSWYSPGILHGYGNYWSDWKAPDDTAPFGIVDNPYDIAGISGLKDYYPMTRFIEDSTDPTTTVNLSGTIGLDEWYLSRVEVTLTPVDNPDGIGVYVTKYRVDGDSWQDYSAVFILSSHGIHVLDYYSMDYSGNSELAKSIEFKVDSSPPSGSIIIQDGLQLVNTTSVSLTLNAEAVLGVAGVRYRNVNSLWTEWEAFSESKSWTLTPGDGLKTVYFQAMDSAGLISEFSDSITLDTGLPAGSITIAEGAEYVHEQSVTLALDATDTVSGVDVVRYSNDGSDWTAWMPYSPYMEWDLTPGDGLKTVYYQIVDNAGLTLTCSDTVVLDTVSPTCSIIIDDGATYANSTSVILILVAEDLTSGINCVSYGNSPYSMSEWDSFSPTKVWNLTEGDGTKTVYYSILDESGLGATYSDTIILDTTPPSGLIAINSGALLTNTTSVTLLFTVSDITSGVDRMRYGNDGDAWSPWQPYVAVAAWTLPEGDGMKTVHLQVIDNAGLLTTTGAMITLDTIFPSLDFREPDGTVITNRSSTLGWTSADTNGVDYFEYAFDGGPFTSVGLTAQVGLAGLLDGSHVLSVHAIDGAGNTASKVLGFTLETRLQLNVTCDVATAAFGSGVRLSGYACYNANLSGIQGLSLMFYYSVTGGVTWNEITSSVTGSNGDYSVLWMPSATGLYLVKVAWQGNVTHYPCEEIISLAVEPYSDQYVFAVQSNSTVNSIEFNPSLRELSFTVSGEPETMGYSRIFISKELMADASGASVFLDGSSVDFVLSSTTDSWVLYFTYAHSEHTIVASLGPIAEGTAMDLPLLAGVLAAAIAIIVVAILVLRKRRVDR